MGGHLQHLKEVVLLAMVMGMVNRSSGAVDHGSMRKVDEVNKEGPFLGIVVSQPFEINPLIQSPTFVPHETLRYLDIFGTTTKLLLTLFNVKGVLHPGLSRSANPNFQMGDVAIPQYWAHAGHWNWQRFGEGPSTDLAFESFGDYTRRFGYLNFTSFNNHTSNGEADQNLLNHVWYQPEEIFPVDRVPEVRQHAFWVPVDEHYLAVSKKLQGLKLGQCVNSTCLPRAPAVVTVERGVSASLFLDNSAYRQFLYSKFNATAMDMETAAIALVCHQHKMPFIAIRSLIDLAGESSYAGHGEVNVFSSLSIQNAADAALRFIALLFSS
ncbi:hypothetical protein NL676_033392 [Syzygium grande]|nr:hypothetical protein NL676_033392 [Syzygium grande]